MLILFESLTMCFLMLLVCVVGIANGPVGSVYYFEKNVQDRVVELGLTTKDKIRKDYAIAGIFLLVPFFFFPPLMVYFVNGARGFKESFWQLLIILMADGLFDRLFIDWFWVGKTKAWVIPGTEDLMPYIPKKTFVKKWLGTLVGYPLLAVIMAGVLALFS